MHYGDILNLIDLELERLQAARRVLTGEPQTTRTPQGSRAQIPVADATDAEAIAPDEAGTVAVTRLPPRRARSSRGAKPRRAAPTALSASVPAGPVAVTASHVAQEARNVASSVSEPAAPPEGSLEALVAEFRTRADANLLGTSVSSGRL